METLDVDLLNDNLISAMKNAAHDSNFEKTNYIRTGIIERGKPWFDTDYYLAKKSLKICYHRLKLNNFTVPDTNSYRVQLSSYKKLLKEKKM